MAWQQMALLTQDLDQVTLSITLHLEAPSGEVTMGYEITSGPGGEALQMEALGQHWALHRPRELEAEFMSILQAARAYLSPF
jgi:hypothetical protein